MKPLGRPKTKNQSDDGSTNWTSLTSRKWRRFVNSNPELDSSELDFNQDDDDESIQTRSKIRESSAKKRTFMGKRVILSGGEDDIQRDVSSAVECTFSVENDAIYNEKLDEQLNDFFTMKNEVESEISSYVLHVPKPKLTKKVGRPF